MRTDRNEWLAIADRESPRKVSLVKEARREKFPRFYVPALFLLTSNQSNEESIMMFKALWMVRPNERFLFPLEHSAEIFKLVYVLYHARNLKETQNIAKGRSSWRTRVYFLLRKLDEGKTFRKEHDGSFLRSALSVLERVIYGLNITKVSPIEFVTIYSLWKIKQEVNHNFFNFFLNYKSILTLILSLFLFYIFYLLIKIIVNLILK